MNQPAAAGAVLGPLGLASRQHSVHPFVSLFMSFESVNPFRRPAVLQRAVQFHCQGLQLHATLEGVRSLRAPANDLVDSFIDIDERLFHSPESKASASTDARNASAEMRAPGEQCSY